MMSKSDKDDDSEEITIVKLSKSKKHKISKTSKVIEIFTSDEEQDRFNKIEREMLTKKIQIVTNDNINTLLKDEINENDNNSNTNEYNNIDNINIDKMNSPFQKSLKYKNESLGKIKIYIKNDDELLTFYLGENEVLEDVLEDKDFLKIKYNGLPVSKYLTLDEIGFDINNPYFEVVESENTQINLKVNVDFFSVKNITIGKNKYISEIIEKSGKEGLVVMNGIIIDKTKKVKDVFENDDVIDIVSI